MNEKRIIFDKSFIQGSKFEDLDIFNKPPYNPLITQGFLHECLGNLVKEKANNSSTNEQNVASFFRKIKSFPISTLKPQDLMRNELIEDRNISLRHNFFNYDPIRKDGKAIDVFNSLEAREYIERLSRGDFLEEDYKNAEIYLKEKECKLKELKNFDADKLDIIEIIGSTKVKIQEIPQLLSVILTRYIEWILRECLKKGDNIKNARDKIKRKILDGSFSEFAPYSSYVFTVDFLFHRYFLQTHHPQRGKKVANDWVDFNYLYYLPFVDCLATDENKLTVFINDLFKNIEIIKPKP